MKIFPVNYARPNWTHAAHGIRCRADWAGAQVYKTEVGDIIAYSQKDALHRAQEIKNELTEQKEELETQIEMWN